MNRIDISRDYTETPGARYIADGEYSGQDFREKHLEPLFADKNDNSKISITLDGVEGYSTSFLEEAFGGLARIYGRDRCIQRLEFISEVEPALIDTIKSYIINCESTTKSLTRTEIVTHS